MSLPLFSFTYSIPWLSGIWISISLEHKLSSIQNIKHYNILYSCSVCAQAERTRLQAIC